MISLLLTLAALAAPSPETSASPETPAPAKPSLNYYAYGWAEMPSPFKIDGSRPMSAFAGRRAASVTLFCTLTAEGRLDDCQALEEAPAGKGFAKAALKLSGDYRLNLPGDGRPIAGETVRFVIAWEGAPEKKRQGVWARAYGGSASSGYTPPRVTMPTGRPASVP